MAKTKSGRIFTFAAAIATLAALAAIFVYGLAPRDTAEANHGATPGVVDLVAIDADPSGNSAHVVGTIDECIVSSSGNTINVDIVVDEVHTNDRLSGIDLNFLYNPALVNVLSITDSGSSVLMGADGSAVLSFGSDPATDANDDPDAIAEGLDGSIKISAGDFGNTTANFGPGLLARISLQLVGTGQSDLTLADTLLVDGNNVALPVVSIAGTKIAAGVACPGSVPKADIAVSDVVVASPASVNAGASFQVTADALVTNNGPDAATVDVETTLSLPFDCSTASANPIISLDVSLAASASGRYPSPAAVWDVSCTQASNHNFSVTVTAVTDPAETVDNVQTNNQATGQDTTAIAAEADVKLSAVVLTVPAQIVVGRSFEVSATATVHNNGPLSSVSAGAFFTLTAPSQCDIGLANFSDHATFTLAASSAVALDAGDLHWRVTCNQPGPMSFSVSGQVVLGVLHVTDTNLGNNTGTDGTDTASVIGACQQNTDPEGNPKQTVPPALLLALAGLTAGNPVPEAQQVPLDCRFNWIFDDNGTNIVDDCELDLVEPVPCTITIDVSIDQVGGTPAGTPGARLAPIAVNFMSAGIEFTPDLGVPNGATAGSGSFSIRTDAGLGTNGGECTTDAIFNPTPSTEGGLVGNAPDSNLDAALTDPLVWPNDLNGERALVESSLQLNPIGPPALTLWSRTVIALEITGVLELSLNALIWHIDDPILQTLSDSEWVMVAFPGDAVNPDLPGPVGGDPDADDPPEGGGTFYCTPHRQTLTFLGEVGGVTRNTCVLPDQQMGWALWDPNAIDFAGDDSWRSNLSPCSLDTDGDGLTNTEETYWGTSPINTDSDADGDLDGADNCPATANADQADYDGDFLGDACDPDIDGDGSANASDLCPSTALGDGADAAGCSQAQVDADADGACNPGAPSGGPTPSCAGTDLCPNTAVGANADAAGCSQPQVDGDADGACNAGAPSGGPTPSCTGTDNCPGLANPSQSDVDNDAFGDACDGCPSVATDWAVPANDDDCDGFSTVDEMILGTDPNAACGFTPGGDPASENWPADLVESNSINIQDPLALKPVFLGTVPDTASVRNDLVPSGVIDISDVLMMKPFFGKSCN
ncbi:MAG: thrombospondin type 3 repeat-containing protein [Dehalococcoidia bacterium]